MHHSATHPSSFGTRAKPPTHIVTISKGRNVRSFRIRPWMLVSFTLVLILIGSSFLAATSYLVFRDDILNAAIARQHYLSERYENHIATLRQEIDRVASRQLLNQEAYETKMAQLIERQNVIAERDLQMAELIAYAKNQGWDLFEKASKESAQLQAHQERHSLAFLPKLTERRTGQPQKMLGDVHHSLEQVEQRQMRLVYGLKNIVAEQHKNIIKTLDGLNINQKALLSLVTKEQDDVGGPLLPPRHDNPLGDDATDLMVHLNEVGRLRKALHYLPLKKPVFKARYSSNFGNRRDPFTGKLAFHSGIDFAAPTGHRVRSSGHGLVTFAGRRGGYGLMVEISHGLGFKTRYAHLSVLKVMKGQHVDSGAVIGLVGSTGRSTGPHLHYETRLEDKAINPSYFIKSGKKLARYF